MNSEKVGNQWRRPDVCLLDPFYDRSIFKRLFFLFQNFAKIFPTGSLFALLPLTILSPQSSKWNIQKMLMRLGHSLAQNASVSFIFIFTFFPIALPANAFLSSYVLSPGSRLVLSFCWTWQDISYLSFLTYLNIIFSDKPYLTLFPSLRTLYKFLSEQVIIHSNISIWVINYLIVCLCPRKKSIRDLICCHIRVPNSVWGTGNN